MSPVTEGTVDGNFSRSGSENVENFPDHDRAMHPRGCLAAGKDFGDIRGVAIGLAFFVLLVEVTGILARVASSARGF